MKFRGLPNSLRSKIRRYFDYNWELRKQIKIDEDNVMSELNKDLRNKITIHLNGKLLIDIEVFQNFSSEFLS